MSVNIVPYFWYGIVSGSIFAVAALGLTLIFGILNFINIAYGDFMVVGAYLTLAGAVRGLPMWLAAIIGIAAAALTAIIADRVVFKQFRSQSPIILLVVSIGVAFIIRNLVRAIWGTGGQFYPVDLGRFATVADVNILTEQVLIIVSSVVIVTALYLLLQRTRVGIAMRATSDDSPLAEIRGIDTERLIVMVWIIGGAISGIAGILLALDSQLKPNMGFRTLIPVFAAVFIGGIGDPVGAIIGGYALGLAQELSAAVLPAEYKPAVALIVLVLGLLWRPEGIFGETTR